MTWLYTGRICTEDDDISENEQDCGGAIDTCELDQLAECLDLTHRLGDDSFYNALINAIIDVVTEDKTFPVFHTEFLHAVLPKGSPALKLMADFWIFCGDLDKPGWQVLLDDCDSVDHLKAVVQGLMRKDCPVADEDLPWIQNRCQYHIHADGEKCV